MKSDIQGVIFRGMRGILGGLAAGGLVFAPSLAGAYDVDFDFAGGTIITTQYQSDTGLTISTDNDGGGPNIGIVFDTEPPVSGGDTDLARPFSTVKAWDVSWSGTTKQGTLSGGANHSSLSGPNSIAGELANPEKILIVAEDAVDKWNNQTGAWGADGLIDDPDDEAGGGFLKFYFDDPVTVDYLDLFDIDNTDPKSSWVAFGIGATDVLPDFSPGGEDPEDVVNDFDTHSAVDRYFKVNTPEVGEHGAARFFLGGLEDVKWMMVGLSSSGATSNLKISEDVTPPQEEAPEPGTLGLVGVGFGVIAAARRRRKKSDADA